jgi:hypothetical protein
MSVGSTMKTDNVIRSLLTLSLLVGCAASTVMAEENSQPGLKAEATVPEVEARRAALSRWSGDAANQGTSAGTGDLLHGAPAGL